MTMGAGYPMARRRKRRLRPVRTVLVMPWSMLWAYAALLDVTGVSDVASVHLVAGFAVSVLLAVVVAAALVAGALPSAARSHGFPAATRRRHFRGVPRLIDPDAAGRPRSRAPSTVPSAA
jgi:hypothetical protein